MERFMIVGLGNPGKKYAYTRHNIGFMCVDALAARYEIAVDNVKFQAKFGEGTIVDRRVVLVKPQTYMNASGVAVRGLASFYKIPPEQILLIYDDLDTPVGTLRIRAGGGAGGQKGVRSTIEHLGTENFPRVRFGIGRPPGKMDAAAYVLQEFIKDEVPLVRETIDRAIKGVEIWLAEGIEMAMNRQNGTAEQAAAAQPKPEKIVEKDPEE